MSIGSDLARLKENVARAYRGDLAVIDLVLTALLSRRHILIEDVPGVGKTTLARALGRSLSLEFRRIQFTSDTLPADVLGISVFHAATDAFEFHAGPLFANIVLADEINRATPKTQSALLEAMNEGAVTIESEHRPLPRPFMVVATQNPVEYLGTYPLPESQMDRFFLKLTLGYPTVGEEKALLRRGGTERDLAALLPVLERERVLELQDATEGIRVADRLLVIEMLTVPCEPNVSVGLVDMIMLMFFGEARQRTIGEYSKLFGSTQFALIRVLPTASAFSIVEARAI